MRNLWWQTQAKLNELPPTANRSHVQHEYARNLERHLDIHNELERRRYDSETPSRNPDVGTLNITEIHIDDKKATPWEKLGPAQRESLLAFVIATDIEDAMSHAEGDNIVYDALGEHRILGPHRKVKGRILSSTTK